MPETKGFDDRIVDTLNKADQLLWKVFAIAEPSDCDAKKKATLIGEVYSRGGAIKSTFGDKEVMFQHNDFAKDLEVQPAWKDKIARFVKPGIDQFANDKEEFAKFGDEATKGCPYMALMNLRERLQNLDLSDVANNLDNMGKNMEDSSVSKALNKLSGNGASESSGGFPGWAVAVVILGVGGVTGGLIYRYKKNN